MPSKTKRESNWLYMLVSVLIAVALWYMVTGRERVEVQAEIRLEYKGLPPDMVVREGLVGSVRVRLRGPAVLVRTMNFKEMGQVINLSGVHTGNNSVPIPWDSIPGLRAFEVIDMNPSSLELQVENMVERSVPVDVKIKIPMAGLLQVSNVMVNPSSVILHGPESLVNRHKKITLDVPLDSSQAPGEYRVQLALPAIDMVEARPDTVEVRYLFEVKRSTISLQRLIQPNVSKRREFHCNPSKADIQIEIPESLLKNSNYLASIRAIVAVESMHPGSSAELPVEVILPEGARLVSVEPNSIQVTRKKP